LEKKLLKLRNERKELEESSLRLKTHSDDLDDLLVKASKPKELKTTIAQMQKLKKGGRTLLPNLKKRVDAKERQLKELTELAEKLARWKAVAADVRRNPPKKRKLEKIENATEPARKKMKKMPNQNTADIVESPTVDETESLSDDGIWTSHSEAEESQSEKNTMKEPAGNESDEESDDIIEEDESEEAQEICLQSSAAEQNESEITNSETSDKEEMKEDSPEALDEVSLGQNEEIIIDPVDNFVAKDNPTEIDLFEDNEDEEIIEEIQDETPTEEKAEENSDGSLQIDPEAEASEEKHSAQPQTPTRAPKNSNFDISPIDSPIEAVLDLSPIASSIEGIAEGEISPLWSPVREPMAMDPMFEPLELSPIIESLGTAVVSEIKIPKFKLDEKKFASQKGQPSKDFMELFISLPEMLFDSTEQDYGKTFLMPCRILLQYRRLNMYQFYRMFMKAFFKMEDQYSWEKARVTARCFMGLSVVFKQCNPYLKRDNTRDGDLKKKGETRNILDHEFCGLFTFSFRRALATNHLQSPKLTTQTQDLDFTQGEMLTSHQRHNICVLLTCLYVAQGQLDKLWDFLMECFASLKVTTSVTIFEIVLDCLVSHSPEDKDYLLNTDFFSRRTGLLKVVLGFWIGLEPDLEERVRKLAKEKLGFDELQMLFSENLIKYFEEGLEKIESCAMELEMDWQIQKPQTEANKRWIEMIDEHQFGLLLVWVVGRGKIQIPCMRMAIDRLRQAHQSRKLQFFFLRLVGYLYGDLKNGHEVFCLKHTNLKAGINPYEDLPKHLCLITERASIPFESVASIFCCLCVMGEKKLALRIIERMHPTEKQKILKYSWLYQRASQTVQHILTI